MKFLYGTCDIPLSDIYSVYTPEIQAEYPCILLAVWAWTGFHATLIITKEPCIYTDNFGMTKGQSCLVSGIDIADTGTENDLSNEVFPTPREFVLEEYLWVPYTGTVWANYPVYKKDGTLYLAASAPVPIPMKKGSLYCSCTPRIPASSGHGNLWVKKTWNGFSDFVGYNVWTDGTNIYCSSGSSGSKQYVLIGDTWEEKVWNGVSSPNNQDIWTDGTNIYYSSGSTQYVLNGDTWEEKVWNISLTGAGIWSDGTSIYYSMNTDHYVLNGDAWEKLDWNIDVGWHWPSASYAGFWSDGTNVYFSKGSKHYVLNGDTWEEKEWNIDIDGRCVWTDGTSTYYSKYGNSSEGIIGFDYVLNGDTWEKQEWTFDVSPVWPLHGVNIWTDGRNFYYSYGDSDQYVLVGTDPVPVPVPQLNPAALMQGLLISRQIPR